MCKLKRNLKGKKNRVFWAGVEKAVQKFYKLPQWQQDELNRIHKEFQDKWLK